MINGQLGYYNTALGFCGERALSGLTEARAARRYLDAVWAEDPIRTVLEMGLWTFATRSAGLGYDSTITPGFGYRYAFPKPADYVQSVNLSSDEYFNDPLTRFTDEGGVWYADLDTIYVKWVSDDTDWGRDLTKWGEASQQLLAAYLAKRVVFQLTQSTEKRAYVCGKDGEGGLYGKAREVALSKDAIKMPTAFMPRGSWSRARQGGGSRGPFRNGNGV